MNLLMHFKYSDGLRIKEMISCEKYNKELSEKKDYHIHTNFINHADKSMTIPNIIKQAQKVGLVEIAITEHVRRTSDWIDKYLNKIRSYSNNSEIEILTGFETRILPGGILDIEDRYLTDEYFIIASFHTFLEGKKEWLNSLIKIIENPYINVLGHIGTKYNGYDPTKIDFYLTTKELEKIAYLISSNNKLVEINASHILPFKRFLDVFKEYKVKFVLGSDAHSICQIGDFKSIKHLIKVVE